MKDDKEVIIEQLLGAMSGARKFVRTMYVYRGDDERWWISGKLPKNTEAFYVAYPNGEFGRSEGAPEISNDDYRELKAVASTPAKKALLPKPKVKIAPWQAFGWYAAFAPYAQFALAVALSPLLGIPEPFDFAAKSALFTLPVTLIYASFSARGRAFLPVMIGAQVHVVFLAIVVFSSLTGVISRLQDVIAPLIMVCMAASGATMLMTMDVIKKEENQSKTTQTT
jgi:hypothetical protein